MCPGPNLAPGREETPGSKGMPTIATSGWGTSSVRGSRAKVAGPAYRGTRVASTGPMGSCGVIEDTLPQSPGHGYSRFVEVDSWMFDDMSMLTVAELLADAELALQLVAGQANV